MTRSQAEEEDSSFPHQLANSPPAPRSAHFQAEDRFCKAGTFRSHSEAMGRRNPDGICGYRAVLSLPRLS